MKRNTFAAIGLVAAAVLAVLGCRPIVEDPGQPGQPKKVVIAISDGTEINHSTYGLWHADDDAPENCRWHITLNEKTVARGGVHDSIIAGSGLRGGILHTNCGKFYK